MGLNNENKIYLSGLNGLRAIAAISVLVSHVGLKLFKASNLNIYKIDLNFDGVTLFFVISGFLITYLLLIEKDKSLTIDIPKFYIRRILRIWPIYYLIIALTLFILIFVSNISMFHTFNVFYYIFFAANIPFVLSQGIPLISHYWSIGVEEQFYLFWPWIVRNTRNQLLYKVLALFIFIFIIKLGFWYFLGSDSLLYRFFVVTRFHCMMIGAIGAILFMNPDNILIKLCSNKYVQIVNWILVLLLLFGLFRLPAPISVEITSILSLILIIGQITVRNRIVNLELIFFNFLGRISYGLYVIHPLVIYVYTNVFSNVNISSLSISVCMYVLVLITTIGLAYFSYEYFEKRFLKMKTKYSVVISTNQK